MTFENVYLLIRYLDYFNCGFRCSWNYISHDALGETQCHAGELAANQTLVQTAASYVYLTSVGQYLTKNELFRRKV